MTNKFFIFNIGIGPLSIFEEPVVNVIALFDEIVEPLSLYHLRICKTIGRLAYSIGVYSADYIVTFGPLRSWNIF